MTDAPTITLWQFYHRHRSRPPFFRAIHGTVSGDNPDRITITGNAPYWITTSIGTVDVRANAMRGEVWHRPAPVNQQLPMRYRYGCHNPS